jgi:hypothetical protein
MIDQRKPIGNSLIAAPDRMPVRAGEWNQLP